MLSTIFTTAVKVGEKEVENKVVGAFAGGIAIATIGTVFGIHEYRKNKSNKAASSEEEAEEEEQATTTEEVTTSDDKKDPSDQAPEEESGAEKINASEQQAMPQQNVAEPMTGNFTPQQKVAEHIASNFTYQNPNIINPAFAGPNPAFKFINGVGMGFPTYQMPPFPGAAPGAANATVPATEPSVSPILEERDNQVNQTEEVKVENTTTSGNEVKQPEQQSANNAAEDNSLAEETIVYTAKDMAEGKKPGKRKGKTKSVSIPETKVNIPSKKK